LRAQSQSEAFISSALDPAENPALVVTQAGGELGIEDAVDEALFELGEQAVRAEQVAGLAVVFE
jgi:hypothetical protein